MSSPHAVFLAEEKYLLKDKENEAKYDFTLDESLARAKELQGRLFRNTLFYITSKVPVDFKLLKNVVTAFGGEVSGIV